MLDKLIAGKVRGFGFLLREQSMRQPLVAGNWKMNESRDGARSLIAATLAGLSEVSCEVAICPPYVFLSDALSDLQGSAVALGAQDVSAAEKGAFTGQISAPMLSEFGCRYVIVGHSERRHGLGETDALVAEKHVAVQRHSMTPILCVGETLEERESERTMAVIKRQLDAVLTLSGIDAFANAVIAYEPVWAIGTGKTATPEQAQEVHSFIRARLSEARQSIGEEMRILYGGSVKAANAETLFAQPDIDGGLIGGASLDAGEFLAICRAANAR